MKKYENHIIVTIHGIRQRVGQTWQRDFKTWVNNSYPEIKVLNYTYGFVFAVMSWWITLSRKLGIPSYLRKRYIGGFQNYLIKLKKQYPNHKISIVSHSFGTWVSYYALNREPELSIHNLVLVQGVISSHVEKLDIVSWLRRGKLNSVYAWSSHEDEVVCVVALPPFGKVGCRGFVRKTHDEDYTIPNPKPYDVNLYNVHTVEEHGSIWDKPEKYWKELIRQCVAEND